ncbi:hypothetical protein A3SI_16727 [Nitritalea halalkaliphila LW7]|uniref:DUF4842 domain-containing protein n=1 Tax=Nitritalea halalkaliphila LW7 TaxID=1189621 RepID=I5BWS0_9BACT|nr:LruC domain-containing protein [Nitritalea halalkaliphila]EIM74022.1 hypothetical protein A3SI_16727 [Nitritalea halalkaliphila LW7]
MTKLFSSIASIGLFGLLWSPLAQAQIFNAELGSTGPYRTACWGFNGTTIDSSIEISGSYTVRTTNSVNTSTIGEQSIVTPWLLINSGNISFKLKTDGGSATNRTVHLSYIPHKWSGEEEGTPIHFFSESLADPSDPKVRTYSIEVPWEILRDTHYTKIMISFTGSGGEGRIALDDFSLHGNTAADPTRNCTIDETRTYTENVISIFGTEGYSTLMFEDLWPGLGDYDFNDLVLGIKGERLQRSKDGILKEIRLTIQPRAAGAAFDNSFGIHFPSIPIWAVEEVRGTVKGKSVIFNYLPNGAEANQSHLTVIVFENVRTLIPANNPFLVGVPDLEPIVIHIKVNEGADFPAGTEYDMSPFLIVNQERGREIHLPGREGTDLADPSLFGTASDNALYKEVRYTSKENGLPWVMFIPADVPFMREKNNITEGYLKMKEWAKSNGSKYQDWFIDKPGYRDESKLFKK